jgi:hypothetical protein
MIRKQETIVSVEEPTIAKNKKGAAGQEFNIEHAHFFSA